MSNTENLNNKEGIDKLKSLVDDIMICLFCTNLKQMMDLPADLCQQ